MTEPTAEELEVLLDKIENLNRELASAYEAHKEHFKNLKFDVKSGALEAAEAVTDKWRMLTANVNVTRGSSDHAQTVLMISPALFKYEICFDRKRNWEKKDHLDNRISHAEWALKLFERMPPVAEVSTFVETFLAARKSLEKEFEVSMRRSMMMRHPFW